MACNLKGPDSNEPELTTDDSNTLITITNFINPHLFWFMDSGPNNSQNDEEFITVENLIDKHVQEMRNSQLKEGRNYKSEFGIGEKVSVYYLPWKRHVRGHVLHNIVNDRQGELFVWLDDYGFPAIVKSTHLFPNCKIVDSIPSRIKCAGIVNTQPAEVQYDFVEGSLKDKQQEHWSQKACDMVQKMILDALHINFIVHFTTISTQYQTNMMVSHHWGDLIITNHKNKINVQDLLMLARHAIIVREVVFIEQCRNQSLQTTKIPNWMTNDRKILNCNHAKLNSQETYRDRYNTSFNLNGTCHWQNGDDQKDSPTGMSNAMDTTLCSRITNHDCEEIIDKYKKLYSQKNYIGKAGALTKPDRFIVCQMASPNDGAFAISEVEEGVSSLSTSKLPQCNNRLVLMMQMLREKQKKITDKVHEASSNNMENCDGKTVKAQLIEENDKTDHLSIEISDDKSIGDNSDANYSTSTIYPAGFDLTRLRTYRNPETHWHRKKTTRFDTTVDSRKHAYTKSTKPEADNPDTQRKILQSSVDQKLVVDSDPNLNDNEYYPYPFTSASTLEKLNPANTMLIMKYKNEHILKAKFIQHLVLVHSKCEDIQSIESLDEVPFLPIILERLLKMGIDKVYRIQVYSWSHIMKGNSFFVINPKQSGKTWSYLPVICNQLLKDSDKCQQQNESYGPIVIILVPSAKEAELITKFCMMLMFSYSKEVISFFGMRNFTETKLRLLNGCDILVVTTASFKRILKANNDENLISKARLKCIVIDSMDEIVTRCPDNFNLVLRSFRSFTTKDTQLIVTSRDWDGRVMDMIQNTLNPLLVIGDFLEAAVYAQTTISIKLCGKEHKDEMLLHLLQSLINSVRAGSRTLILCSDDKQVNHLNRLLWKNGYPNISYFSASNESERQIIDEWQYSKITNSVVICSDAHLAELCVRKTHNLIHYTLATSWTSFVYRFSTLIQNYSVFNEQCSDSFDQKTLSVVFLDEDNNTQLPRLVNFMQKHNQNVDPQIVAVANYIRLEMEKDRQRKGVALCEQVLEFGECDYRHCKYRHTLCPKDIYNVLCLPLEGEIEICILKVFSPAHYSARILKHKSMESNCSPGEWKIVRRSDEVLAFSTELNIYYGDEDNLIAHWPPHLNDICIYKHKESYQRAQIIQEPALDYKLNILRTNLTVSLKLIDVGDIIYNVYCSEIFKCAERFQEFPKQAIDIRLSNLVPFDNERTWDSMATQKVKRWIMDDLKNSRYVIRGNINFILSGTVWIHNLFVLEYLEAIKTYAQVINIQKLLVSMEYAVWHKNRMVMDNYGNDKHISLRVEKNENDRIQDQKGVDERADNIHVENDQTGENKNEKQEEIQLKRENDNIGFSKEDIGKGYSSEKPMDGIENACFVDNHLKENVEELTLNYHEQKDPCDSFEMVFNLKKNVEELTLNYHEQKDPCGSLEMVLTGARAVPLKQFDSSIKKTNGEEEKDPSAMELWCEINKNKLIQVEFYDEAANGDWENFFVQLNSKEHRRQFEELTSKINKHVGNLKANLMKEEAQIDLTEFKPLSNFIIRHEEDYFRAKLCGIFGSKPGERMFRFFLCDGAICVYIKEEELFNDCCYSTTQELVNFTPYQTVHCQLAGVKWDRYKDRYPLVKRYCYIYAVMSESEMMGDVANAKYQMDMNSYSVLLFECDDHHEFEMINTEVILQSQMHRDPTTAHYLHLDLDMIIKSSAEQLEWADDKAWEESLENDDFEVHLNNDNHADDKCEKSVRPFDKLVRCLEMAKDEEVLQFFKNFQSEKEYQREEDSKITKTCETIDDSSLKLMKYTDSTISSTPKAESEQAVDTCTVIPSKYRVEIVPVLKILNKPIMTTWTQKDWVLTFCIHTPDLSGYDVHVKKQVLLFAAKSNNGENFAFILQFLGNVRPEMTTQEIRGTHVIVRLIKDRCGIWPRPFKDNAKYSWLTYDFNAMNVDERIMMERLALSKRKYIKSEQYDSDFSENDDPDNADDVKRELCLKNENQDDNERYS